MDNDFQFKIPFSMVICSRRNSGKTHLMKHFLNYFFNNKLFDYVVVFSETAKISGDFDDLVPPKCLMDEFNEKAISRIIEYQIKEKKKKKPKQCIIVLDDTISAMSHKFVEELNRLFSKARHWNISLCLISQYIRNVITPTIRGNIDYLLYSCNTTNVYQFIYDIVIYDGNVKEFIKWSQDNTKDFQFIMYKNIHGGEFFFIKCPAELKLNKIKC